jgi:toxin-antitoxin system PIN domain toxin
MARSYFLDANVWLALIWDGHLHSRTAQHWFNEVSEEAFSFCRLTQITVLRLLTTDSVMGRDARTMADAWKLWDSVARDGRISFVDEPAGFDKLFRSHSRWPSRSPKVWADAYLLAFASAAGLRIVTFDRALGSREADVLVL